MPRLFRQKLSCFYCGSRSAQDYSSDIRKWKCEKCEALNYLDEVSLFTSPSSSPFPWQHITEWRNHRSAAPRFVFWSSICSVRPTCSFLRTCICRRKLVLRWMFTKPKVLDRGPGLLLSSNKCPWLSRLWSELPGIPKESRRSIPTSMSPMRTSCPRPNTVGRICRKDRSPTKNDGAVTKFRQISKWLELEELPYIGWDGRVVDKFDRADIVGCSWIFNCKSRGDNWGRIFLLDTGMFTEQLDYFGSYIRLCEAVWLCCWHRLGPRSYLPLVEPCTWREI